MCKAWRAGGTSTVNNRFIRVGFVTKSEQRCIRCFRGSWGKTRDALKKNSTALTMTPVQPTTQRWRYLCVGHGRGWQPRHETQKSTTKIRSSDCQLHFFFNQFYDTITALCKCFHWLKPFLRWAMYPMDLCKINVLINNHFCYFCVILFLYYVKGNFKKYSLEYG